MKLRVKVFWDGQRFKVDLPDYSMVPGTFLPLTIDGVHPEGVLPTIDPTSPSLSTLTCEVNVPDRLVDSASGQPDIELIRALYRGNPDWDNEAKQLNI